MVAEFHAPGPPPPLHKHPPAARTEGVLRAVTRHRRGACTREGEGIWLRIVLGTPGPPCPRLAPGDLLTVALYQASLLGAFSVGLPPNFKAFRRGSQYFVLSPQFFWDVEPKYKQRKNTAKQFVTFVTVGAVVWPPEFQGSITKPIPVSNGIFISLQICFF